MRTQELLLIDVCITPSRTGGLHPGNGRGRRRAGFVVFLLVVVLVLALVLVVSRELDGGDTRHVKHPSWVGTSHVDSPLLQLDDRVTFGCVVVLFVWLAMSVMALRQ